MLSRQSIESLPQRNVSEFDIQATIGDVAARPLQRAHAQLPHARLQIELRCPGRDLFPRKQLVDSKRRLGAFSNLNSRIFTSSRLG